MAETFEKCGIWDDGNNGYNDIFCCVETGDAIYASDISGDCLMSEITVEYDPSIQLPDIKYEQFCDAYKADGVIFSDKYVILLHTDSMTADYYNYGAMDKPVHSVKFNTDIMYETSSGKSVSESVY